MEGAGRTPSTRVGAVDAAEEGPVYVIVDVQVLEKELFLEYARGHIASLEAYGGRILFRSFDLEPIEGDWRPECLVVHEWPTVRAFRDWWQSKEYEPWAEMRRRSASIRMVLARAGF